MSIKAKDVLIRAMKTFWQAALAYAIPLLAVVDFFDGDKWKTALAGIGMSALAAGLSAVWNAVISPLLQTKTKAQ